MLVVDTSVWVEFFRGREPWRTKLTELLDTDEVALAAPVRIEILGGASRTEQVRLRRVLGALPQLRPTDATWDRMEDWVTRAVAAGQRFGVVDLLVAAITVDAGADIWSLDADFARMARLGLVTLRKP